MSSIESQFSKASGCRQILQDVNIIHEKNIEDFKCRETILDVKDGDVATFNANLLFIERMQELGFLTTIAQWSLHVAKLWEVVKQ